MRGNHSRSCEVGGVVLAGQNWCRDWLKNLLERWHPGVPILKEQRVIAWDRVLPVRAVLSDWTNSGSQASPRGDGTGARGSQSARPAGEGAPTRLTQDEYYDVLDGLDELDRQNPDVAPEHVLDVDSRGRTVVVDSSVSLDSLKPDGTIYVDASGRYLAIYCSEREKYNIGHRVVETTACGGEIEMRSVPIAAGASCESNDELMSSGYPSERDAPNVAVDGDSTSEDAPRAKTRLVI